MTLTYDFDIFDVIPGAGPQDPDLDGFLTQIGFKPDPAASRIALFRDPRTADALRRAPDNLRNFFLASGFGLNTYSSGAPRGRYPAKDEEARLELIHRLTQNAETHSLPPLQGYPEGGDVFRLGEFLTELTCAEPMDLAEGFTQDFDARDAAAVEAQFEDIIQDPAPVKEAKPFGFPPIFETDPLPPQAVEDQKQSPARRKFWQNRFFLMGTAAALAALAVVVQLASGQSVLALASL